MNKISKQIRDYLLQEKYLIAASNDENIIIRFQNQLISIFPDSEEDSYCSVCLPTFLDSMPLQKEKLQMICNTIMANQNTIKAILVETGIIIRYDFIWQNSEELHRQLKQGIEQVAATKKQIANAARLAYYIMSNQKEKEYVKEQ